MIYPYNYLCDYRRSRFDQRGLKVVTYPVLEQVTLEQARLHLRLDSYGSPSEHADDQWILDNIPTAREWCEFEHGSSMAPQVLELSMRRFPHAWISQCTGDEIKLPMGPIAGVESISYIDAAGVLQTLGTEAYTCWLDSEPGYVYPIINTCWPVTADVVGAVRIRYHAGFTTPNDSPDDMPLPKFMRSSMLLTLGTLYENRENVTELNLNEFPQGARALLMRDRMRTGFA